VPSPEAATTSATYPGSRPLRAPRRFHLSLRGGAPYHPNAAWMAAVADLVLATLESS
jgi:hypothetical protein